MDPEEVKRESTQIFQRLLAVAAQEKQPSTFDALFSPVLGSLLKQLDRLTNETAGCDFYLNFLIN